MKELDDESVDELMRRITDKEITLCETCDRFFPYSPQRQYCSECIEHRKEVRAATRKFRYANDPEFRERHLEKSRQWEAKKRREDPEWAERRNARRRVRYREKEEE